MGVVCTPPYASEAGDLPNDFERHRNYAESRPSEKLDCIFVHTTVSVCLIIDDDSVFDGIIDV